MHNVNILKILSNKSYGIKEEYLFNVYNCLIRSRIDYGNVVYNSANAKLLQKLEVAQNASLRIITGSFRSSPINSILCISGYTSLEDRRKMSTISHTLNMMSHNFHPLCERILRVANRTENQSNSNRTNDFAIRAGNLLMEFEIIPDKEELPPQLSPWLKINFNVNNELLKLKREITHNIEYHEKFNNMCDTTLANMVKIYTDGSKTDNFTGFAFVTNNAEHKFNIPINCSIFTAESFAIFQVILFIKQTHNNDKFAIFTDSASVIQAINDRHHKNKYIRQIQILLQDLQQDQITIVWVPSHVGIQGNEIADLAARNSHSNSIETPFVVPINDLKALAKQKHKIMCQMKWNNIVDNKLKEIKSNLCRWLPPLEMSRSEQVMINRLRIGHSHITHSFLMSGDPPNECTNCNTRLTIKHILIDCSLYTQNRLSHNIKRTLPEILSNNTSDIRNLIDFIKSCNLTNLI